MPTYATPEPTLIDRINAQQLATAGQSLADYGKAQADFAMKQALAQQEAQQYSQRLFMAHQLQAQAAAQQNAAQNQFHAQQNQLAREAQIDAAKALEAGRWQINQENNLRIRELGKEKDMDALKKDASRLGVAVKPDMSESDLLSAMDAQIPKIAANLQADRDRAIAEERQLGLDISSRRVSEAHRIAASKVASDPLAGLDAKQKVEMRKYVDDPALFKTWMSSLRPEAQASVAEAYDKAFNEAIPKIQPDASQWERQQRLKQDAADRHMELNGLKQQFPRLLALDRPVAAATPSGAPDGGLTQDSITALAAKAKAVADAAKTGGAQPAGPAAVTAASPDFQIPGRFSGLNPLLNGIQSVGTRMLMRGGYDGIPAAPPLAPPVTPWGVPLPRTPSGVTQDISVPQMTAPSPFFGVGAVPQGYPFVPPSVPVVSIPTPSYFPQAQPVPQNFPFAPQSEMMQLDDGSFVPRPPRFEELQGYYNRLYPR